MGLGFYELSGGSDFEPAQWRNGDTASEDITATQSVASETPVAFTQPQTAITAAAKPVVNQAKATESLVVLASIPTTRRLVGDASPTPTPELAKLGPKDLIAPQNVDPTKAAYATALLPETAPDFRRVKGNRVNMRNGPGTQYSVVGKLQRDNEVEVLQDPGAGWVKLQVIETGRIGWMSAKLLEKIEF
ncbi:MAG: SH3 domain-containing protein [Cognatishimia sp.]